MLRDDLIMKIEELRKELRYSKNDVARLLDIHPNTYTSWVNKTRKIDLENLEKIAELFKKPIIWFFSTSESCKVSSDFQLLQDSLSTLPTQITTSLTQELAPILETLKTLPESITLPLLRRMDDLIYVRQFIDEMKNQTSHEDLLNKIEELVKKVKLNNLVAEPKKPDNVVQFPFPHKTRKLKVSRAAVGAGKKWAEYANDVAGEIKVECQGKPEYAIIARGFSMEPDIHDGSLLLVRATNLLYKDGDIVIAYLPQDNEWTVKQIFISFDRKQVKLKGTRGYEEKLPASDVIVQGVVEDIIKDPEEVEEILKQHNIDIKSL